MTTRRNFLRALGFTAAGAPLRALAQPYSPKPARVGFLATANAASFAPRVEVLLAALRELGYVEGKNLTMEYRWADGRADRLPHLAADLVRSNVDAIVTSATPATFAAKRATAMIPIVMTVVGDAVESGVVTNLARPDANVTGVTFLLPQLCAKRIEILKELFPRISDIAVLTNPDNPLGFRPVVEAMKAAAGTTQTRIQTLEVRSPADFDGAFDRMERSRAQALVLVDDTMIITNSRLLAMHATKQRLPSIAFTEFAEAGGLLAYGVDRLDMYRRAAYFVDKVLKGTKPSDLPIELPTRFELVVNTKAATALGVGIPASLLLRANRVIT